MIFRFTVLFLLISTLGLSQSSADSLIKLLRNDNDTATIKRHIEISRFYGDNQNLYKAFQYCDSAIKKASLINNQRLLGSAYNHLGNIFISTKDYAKALVAFNSAAKYYNKINYYNGIIAVYTNKGNVYYQSGNLKQAENCFQNGLKECEKHQLTNTEAYTNNLMNLGVINGMQGKYPIAKAYFLQSYDYCNKIKDYHGLAYSINNLGFLEKEKKNYNEAIKYFNQALELKIKYGTISDKISGYGQLAEFYSEIDNNQEALKYAQFGEKLLDTAVINDNILSIYQLLAICYEKKKEFNQSSIYFKKLNYLTQKLNKQQAKSQVEEMEQQLKIRENNLSDSISQQTRIQTQKIELEKSSLISYFLIIIVALGLFFSFFLYRRYIVTKKQKQEITVQKEIIEIQQKETNESINYAKRIQNGLLASKDMLDKELKNYALFYKPKDIVSGDFYWSTELENKFYLAICDSTGHGVPGAFMSLLNIALLSEAIKEKKISEPHLIFNEVRKRLIETITAESHKDGFDGILICIDKTNPLVITYVAANNEPIVIRDNQIIILPKDRMPVGKGEKEESFSLQTIDLQKGDTLYLYTDGYADQFGGEKGKKFKYKALNELLLNNANRTMQEQLLVIETTFNAWKGNLEQVDDVCIIGIKI